MTIIFNTMIRAGILATAFVSLAQADAILKFPLSETLSPDVQFSGGVFSTVNDGNGASLGDQDTRIDFIGPLAFLADFNDPTGSFSLSGVIAVGAPSSGGLISQATAGGVFEVYDPSNLLLLSGTLNDGAIVGGAAETGSFFNTTIANYTGGSLLAYVSPTPAGISLALAGIFTEGQSGLVVDGTLHPFVADASGLLTGTMVPEPASVGLLLAGLLSGGGYRFKKRSDV